MARAWRGVPRPFQARVAFADRQLQGPRRLGDALDPAGPGRDEGARGQFRKRRRGDRGLCGGGRDGGEDPRPGLDPAEKTVQMRAYGAEIELVAGTRQETATPPSGSRPRSSTPATTGSRSSSRGRRRWPMNCGRISASPRPTTSSSPPGAGSNILGCDIGFGELLRRGEIARLPRLFAAQPENCAPHSRKLRAGTWRPCAGRDAPHNRGGDRDRETGARPRSPGRAPALGRRRPSRFRKPGSSRRCSTSPGRPLRGAHLGARRGRVHKTHPNAAPFIPARRPWSY